MQFDQIIGNNIRELRTAKGLSQKQLGERLSTPVALQQIQKYEKGVNRVSAQTLYEFSVILHCPLMAFYQGIKTFEEDLKNLVTLNKRQRENIRAAADNLIDILADARIMK